MIALALIVIGGSSRAQSAPSASAVGDPFDADESWQAEVDAIEDGIDLIVQLLDSYSPTCDECQWSNEFLGYLMVLVDWTQDAWSEDRIRRKKSTQPDYAPGGAMTTLPDLLSDGMWRPVGGTDTWNSSPGNLVWVNPSATFGPYPNATAIIVGCMLMHESSHFDDSYETVDGEFTEGSEDHCAYLNEEISGASVELALLECYLCAYAPTDEEEADILSRIAALEDFGAAKQDELAAAGC